MLRAMAVLGLTWLTVAASPTVADAQNPQTRQGFFIGLGLGPGWFGGEGGGDRETGVAGYVTLGGTLTPQVLLGGEISGWTKEEGGARLSHTNISAALQFYPMVESGLFVRGGIGGSSLQVSSSLDNVSYSIDESGLGGTGGLGYDIRVGSNFSVTPYALFVWGDFDGGSANHFQGGLGAIWH